MRRVWRERACRDGSKPSLKKDQWEKYPYTKHLMNL